MDSPYTGIQHAVNSLFSSLGRQATDQQRADVEKFAARSQELVIGILPIVSQKLQQAGTATLDLDALKAEIRSQIPSAAPGPWIDLATQASYCVLTGLGAPIPESEAA